MAPTVTATPYDFPRLRVSVHLDDDTSYLAEDDPVPEFFDVKFCPYQPLNARPVFAAVSKKHIVICRLTATADDLNPCEIISIIRDDDPEARNYCCTWTKDVVTGKPLLCYGGEDAKIKIYDIFEKKLVNCLVGHGGDICDVVTSPLDPLIVASCSDDTTVRIWSLDPRHEKQPCLCILGGEGHYWNLLTLAWHDTGRYILSAGHDQIINLWTVPDLPTEPTDRPVEVHYPHFSTSEVHSSLVDCVAFFGDYILSRACHDDVIVLWKIEGFSGLLLTIRLSPSQNALWVTRYGLRHSSLKRHVDIANHTRCQRWVPSVVSRSFTASSRHSPITTAGCCRRGQGFTFLASI